MRASEYLLLYVFKILPYEVETLDRQHLTEQFVYPLFVLPTEIIEHKVSEQSCDSYMTQHYKK